MRHTNQKGFAALEALLIVVILVIIGGTGYYVRHSKQVADKSLSAAASSSNASTQSKAPKTLTYTNKTYGFQFTYPAEWGKASLQERSSATAAKAYWINFDTKLTGTFEERGWKPAYSTDGAATVFNNCQFKDSRGTYIFYKTDDACIAFVGSLDSTFAPNEKIGTLVMQKQLPNSRISPLQFTAAPLAGLKDFSHAELKRLFTESYDTTSAPASPLVAFIKSIKELE